MVCDWLSVEEWQMPPQIHSLARRCAGRPRHLEAYWRSCLQSLERGIVTANGSLVSTQFLTQMIEVREPDEYVVPA